MVFRVFGWSFGVTAAGLVAGFLYGGAEALALVAILAVLEISLSFDNAVVNAKVIERMSDFWQKMFLTIGILIAVFGMRLVFPLLIVGITADLGPFEAIDLALEKGDIHEEGSYAFLLNEAHPTIAAFGGMFLLMLFLEFVFDADRELHWLAWLERPLSRIGALEAAAVATALTGLVLSAQYLAAEDKRATVLGAGVLGIITYLVVNGLGNLFEEQGIEEHAQHAAEKSAEKHKAVGPGKGPTAGLEGKPGGPSGLAKATGKAGFFLFLYLEVLDASFSFDGVLGAFAVTQDPIVIALGLGIGAMYIRSFTIYLVRRGTLGDYVFLEHGAMWAIGALAVILLITIKYHVQEIVTGGIGLAFIITALITSVIYNKRNGGPASQRSEPEPVKSGT